MIGGDAGKMGTQLSVGPPPAAARSILSPQDRLKGLDLGFLHPFSGSTRGRHA